MYSAYAYILYTIYSRVTFHRNPSTLSNATVNMSTLSRGRVGDGRCVEAVVTKCFGLVQMRMWDRLECGSRMQSPVMSDICCALRCALISTSRTGRRLISPSAAARLAAAGPFVSQCARNTDTHVNLRARPLVLCIRHRARYGKLLGTAGLLPMFSRTPARILYEVNKQ